MKIEKGMKFRKNGVSSLIPCGLKKEIDHYQELVEYAMREVDSGNERMRGLVEAYSNHRDSLNIRLRNIERGIYPLREVD